MLSFLGFLLLSFFYAFLWLYFLLLLLCSVHFLIVIFLFTNIFFVLFFFLFFSKLGLRKPCLVLFCFSFLNLAGVPCLAFSLFFLSKLGWGALFSSFLFLLMFYKCILLNRSLLRNFLFCHVL